MIKYADTMICFQEIPDEISLSFSITNCPNNCPGCHSPYLKEDRGIPVLETLKSKLTKNRNRVTCVLFLGGDDIKQIEELKECLQICKEAGFKTGLYSGFNDIKEELLPLLDYYKIGSYKKECGGLKSPKTNQRLYKINNNKLEDITYKFWEKHC